MSFVQKLALPYFEAKTFTPSISSNFNSFSKKKTQKMSENGEIYAAGKNFTLPPALAALTNSTSAKSDQINRLSELSLTKDVAAVTVFGMQAVSTRAFSSDKDT